MGGFKKIKKITWFLGVFKNVFLVVSFLSILGLFFTPYFSLAAGVPSVINYQGRLTNSSGDLLGDSGTTYYFKFSIWNNATVGSGTKLWPIGEPATTTANVKQGVFNANIHITDFNFNDSSDAYLQIEVSSDNNSSQTLSPRQRISSTAFAQLAGAVSGSTTPSTFGTTASIGNSVVTIVATSTNATLLSMRAASGQTVNLLDIQNSAGTGLVFVNSSGGIFASSTLQVTDNALFYSSLGIGTTTLGSTLSIGGVGNFSNSATSTLYKGLTLSGITATSSGITISGGALLQTSGGTSTLANGLTLTSGTFKFPGDLCANASNGGVLTTDASGNIVCENDDSSAGGGITTINTLTDATQLFSAINGNSGHASLTIGTSGTDTHTFRISATTSPAFGFVVATSTGSEFNGVSVIGSATSTFSSGVSTGGLSSSAGLTLTAGTILSTGTGTSTFSGGIGATSLLASGGLTISGGAILQTGGATSTLSGLSSSGLTSTAGLNITGGSISTNGLIY
ncbi:MAG TPA: hypothetical protein VJH05_02365, partial [Candidatus Paceibacterota bacterium]